MQGFRVPITFEKRFSPQDSMKPKLVIVLGPTAVGKSEVALQLAQSINSEIVNADSQQVYRHMDIGTGKPSMDDQQCVRHHLIDIVDPDEEFNAAFYRRLATAAIDDIQKRGKNVLVCGGTGLYLKALTHGLFTGPGQDPDLRRRLEQEINENGLAAVYQRLVEIDASVLSSIHPNDRQRIIRALEVLKIGLLRERAELYDLINRRSEQMLEAGLLDEVRGLISRGYSLELKQLRSVGYRQIGEVLQGAKTVVEALEEMKQETRRLAKRQLTWYRADTDIHWYHPEKQQGEVLGAARQFLESPL